MTNTCVLYYIPLPEMCHQKIVVVSHYHLTPSEKVASEKPSLKLNLSAKYSFIQPKKNNIIDAIMKGMRNIQYITMTPVAALHGSIYLRIQMLYINVTHVTVSSFCSYCMWSSWRTCVCAFIFVLFIRLQKILQDPWYFPILFQGNA